MVKPSKTMQPEGVDLSKAGRKSGRAFQGDSFHQYMARKIDLQRSQFGLILPPPPPPEPSALAASSSSSSPPLSTRPHSLKSPSRSPTTKPKFNTSSPSSSGRKRPRSATGGSTIGPPSTTGSNNKVKSVTFAALPLQVQGTVDYGHDDEDDVDDDGSGGGNVSADIHPHSISAILRKLQTRHGKGCRRVLSRHGKRKSRPHKHVSSSSRKKRCKDAESGEVTTRDNQDYLIDKDADVEDEEEEEKVEHVAGKDKSVSKSKCAALAELRTEAASDQDRDCNQKEAPISSISIPTILTSSHDAGEEQSDDGQAPSATGTASPPPSALKLRRERPDLFFLGIVVKVNGYTNPDNETLKRLLQRHGGDFETYETSRVTHIIAEHISTAKANYLKQQRKPRPVVLTAWIMDSIEAGRLLPHGDYLLEEMHDKQKGLVGIKDWFGAKKQQAASVGAKNPAESSKEKPHMYSKMDRSQPNEITKEKLKESPIARIYIDMEPESNHQAKGDHDVLLCTQLTQASQQENDSTQDEEVQMCEQPDEESSFTDSERIDGTYREDNFASAIVGKLKMDHAAEAPLEENQVERPTEAAVTLAAAPESSTHPSTAPQDVTKKGDMDKTTERSQGRTDGKYINGKIRTVGTDPNFLDSFFANSRLSFIGSYKQRTSKEGQVATSFNGDKGRSDRRSKRFVYHVDMDCFFANVVLRNFPQYRDKPVAISHHGKMPTGSRHDDPMDPASGISEKSTSECATCNYHARKFGVKKGMFLGHARQLCPDLIVLHYDFAGYEEVSEQVLGILQRVAAEHEGCVEAVSCDEAYMELYLEYSSDDDKTTTPSHAAGEIAESIRKEIFETTQCTASVGVAANKFLAKVGTDRVKPDGTFVVEDYRHILETLRLRDLHGIGYRSEPKLAAEGLDTVQDVWDLGPKAESELCRILGPGLGKRIFAFCHGRDDREVKPAERKTIGAECNYGVRFDGPYGIDYFMKGLATEVEKRMEGVGCKGRKLTLKVKQRKQGAKPPPKFLGHGSCHNLSKSMDVPGSVATRDAAVFSEIGMTLFRELAIPLDDVRGMGIVVSKLSTDDALESSTATSFVPKGIASFFKNTTAERKDETFEDPCNDPEKANIAVCEGIEKEDSSSHVPDLNSEGGPVDGFSQDSENCMVGDQVGEEIDAQSEMSQVEMQAQGGLDLPPISQICMSQVAALPPEIQEEIRAHMALHSKQNSNAKEAVSEPFDVNADSENRSDGVAELQASRTVSSRLQSSVPQNGQERQQFRQTNLKRMLKLAAAKTGKDVISGMAMEDFQRLPLEIQLQIVNEDSSPIGRLSQKHSGGGNKGHNVKQRAATKTYKPSSRTHGGKTENVIDVEEVIDLQAEHQKITNIADGAAENPDYTRERTDLYDDDIAPLHHFLDENSPTYVDAIEAVGTFLRTCLSERRLNIVPPLMRSIKKRADKWSERSVLLAIIHDLDEDHRKMFNFCLDIDWILRD